LGGVAWYQVLGIVYNANDVPWCGVFVANCLRAAGVDLSGMKVTVRAKPWATWGSILRLAGSRCIARRWPSCIARRWPKGVPVIGKPVRLTASGAPISTNEA
jgi:hypothetical protein